MVIHARNFVTSDDALGGSLIEKSLRFELVAANTSNVASPVAIVPLDAASPAQTKIGVRSN